MADFEAVLKGLEECTEKGFCTKCQYRKERQATLTCKKLLADVLSVVKEQKEQIEQLEHDLAITENNLNYYVNGND